MKFYHINREVGWTPYKPRKAGDVFYVGEEDNPFFLHYSKHIPEEPVQIDGKTVNIPPLTFLRNVNQGSLPSNNLAHISLNAVQYFQMLLREVWWELIRVQEFPDRPSRRKCLWLIPDLAGVDFWLERLQCRQPCQILTVEVEGKTHVANEEYLIGDAMLLPGMYDKARRYWKGEMPCDGKAEVLFEGRIEVVSVIEYQSPHASENSSS